MRGHIEHLASKNKGDRPTFGFLMGEDGVSRFFIPTGLQTTTLKFDDLHSGMAVEFTPIDHPKGPRAIEIRVVAKVKPRSEERADIIERYGDKGDI